MSTRPNQKKSMAGITEAEGKAMRRAAKDMANAIDKLIVERLRPIGGDAIERRKMLLTRAIIAVALSARSES
jgi:hypothetical protein